MTFGGSVAIRAMKDGDFVATIFPGTTVGLQAAIDSLLGGKGKVSVGPGTLDITTAISIHGGCHIEGCGPGMTVIRRATGSWTAGDAARTGNNFLVSPYGANGTNPSSVTFQTDIVLSDMTIDGNDTAFSGNPAIPAHSAITAFFTDGLRLRNLQMKNFLQTAVQFDSCKNGFVSDCRIYRAGQYSAASSRNGINVNSTVAGSVAAGFAKGFVITNCVIDTVNDTHIDIVNCSDVAVSNCTFFNGLFAFEFEGDTSIATTLYGWTISNCNSYGNTGEFFRFAVSAGVDISDISLSNCNMVGHATLHNQRAVILQTDAAVSMSRFTMTGCSFRNINSADAANIGFLISGSTGSDSLVDAIIDGCVFSSAAISASNNNNHGLEFKGNVNRLTVSNCILSNVSGIGVYLHADVNGYVQQSVALAKITVDGARNFGMLVTAGGSASGTVRNVLIDGCTFRDVAQGVNNAAIALQTPDNVAGQTVKDVTVTGCRAARISGIGTFSAGLVLNQNAASTLDNIWVYGNNFTSVSSLQYFISGGTPTNLHFTPPTGKGTAIASAATISIPQDGDTFHVTGAVNITNGITVTPWDNGRTVVLIFDSTPTVTDTGTSKLNGNFVATADDTLTLTCDATNWFEVARSAN